MERLVQAEELVMQGDQMIGLEGLRQNVHERHSDAGLRLFPFQLLCLGDTGERAMLHPRNVRLDNA